MQRRNFKIISYIFSYLQRYFYKSALKNGKEIVPDFYFFGGKAKIGTERQSRKCDLCDILDRRSHTSMWPKENFCLREAITLVGIRTIKEKALFWFACFCPLFSGSWLAPRVASSCHILTNNWGAHIRERNFSLGASSQLGKINSNMPSPTPGIPQKIQEGTFSHTTKSPFGDPLDNKLLCPLPFWKEWDRNHDT